MEKETRSGDKKVTENGVFAKLGSNWGQNWGHFLVKWLRNEVKTGYFGVKIVLNALFFYLFFRYFLYLFDADL